MTTYYKRDKPRITGTFTDTADTPVDPTAVVIECHNPDGTYDGYKYGLSSQGAWNASTNSPSLADGTGTAGYYYTVSVAGEVDFGNGTIKFTTDDIVYYNGEVWQCLHNLSGTSITKSSTGVYYIEHYVDDGGTVSYRIEGVGTAQSAYESTLTVKQPNMR